MGAISDNIHRTYTKDLDIEAYNQQRRLENPFWGQTILGTVVTQYAPQGVLKLGELLGGVIREKADSKVTSEEVQAEIEAILAKYGCANESGVEQAAGLKEAELNVTNLQIDSKKVEIKNTKEAIDKFDDDIKTCNKTIKDLKSQIAELGNAPENAVAVAALEAKVADTQAQLAKLTEQKDLADKKLETLEKEVAELKETRGVQKEELKQIEKDHSTLLKLNAQLERVKENEGNVEQKTNALSAFKNAIQGYDKAVKENNTADIKKYGKLVQKLAENNPNNATITRVYEQRKAQIEKDLKE